MEAAQLFAERCISHLGVHGFELAVCAEPELAIAVASIFATLQDPRLSKPAGPESDPVGGAATAVFAYCMPVGSKADTVRLVGGAIGDAAAYVIPRASKGPTACARAPARQLNSVSRKGGDARDSGGQLEFGRVNMPLNGQVSVFTVDVASEDLVLLCSDGLVDNLDPEDPGSVLAAVVCLRSFSKPLDQACPWTTPAADSDSEAKVRAARVPTARDLATHFPAAEAWDDVSAVSASLAVVRLGHYCEWVTRAQRQQQEIDYEAEIDSRARSQVLRQQLADKNRITDSSEAHAELATIELELDERAKLRRDPRFALAGKTDDLLVVAWTNQQ